MIERPDRFQVAFNTATVAVTGRVSTRSELRKLIEALSVLEPLLPDTEITAALDA